MKCEEFEDRLNEVLDRRGRPEWDAELRLHTETCGECRDRATSYGALLRGFYALTTPEVPADLSIRVLDDYRSRPSLVRRATLATGLFATAAAVWFVLLPLAKTERPRNVARTPSRPIALESWRSEKLPLGWTEMDTLPVVGPVLVSMSDDDESTDPYEALAKGTGQGLASVVLYMPKFGGSPGMISGKPNPPMNGTTRWPEQMSDGLKPVTEVVNETLDILLQVMPASDSARRS